jgi:DNA-directed RNA polymerase II subunit RPB2
MSNVDDEIFGSENNLSNYEEGKLGSRKGDDDSENYDMKIDENEEITQEDAWVVISSFFEKHGLVSQQIGSFNQFLEINIQEIIYENKELSVIPEKKFTPDQKSHNEEFKYEFTFGQLHVSHKPYFKEKDDMYNYIFPNEARIRNLTYESDLLLDITCTAKVIDEVTKRENIKEAPKVVEKNFIGKVPIMVRSKFCSLNEKDDRERVDVKECIFDQGGYFIINGGEKVIVAQERMANNFVYVFRKKEPSKYSWVAEIRSNMESSNRPPSQFTVKIQNKGEKKDNIGSVIKAKIPYIKDDIPIIILFRALGFVADRDILDHILLDNKDGDNKDSPQMELLRPSLEEVSVIQTQEVALDFIGKRGTLPEGVIKNKRIQYAKEILQRDMLPHVSTLPGNETKKAFFIGYMVHRLCTAALGRCNEDDRDHYGKKRLDMAGSLFAGLFRQLFRKFQKETQINLKRMVDTQKDMNLTIALRNKTITQGLRYALATGNWGTNKSGQVIKTGVAQVLNRLTFVSSLSHLRRMNTPLQKQGKLTKPRQLHNTHWGMICPAETPEGQACGLVKNLSLMAYVSVGASTRIVLECLEEQGMENLSELHPRNIPGKARIFVNGAWIGIHNDPDTLVNILKKKRRKCVLPKEVSIINNYATKEIKIYTDSGRAQRPLFIVENNQLKLKKAHVMRMMEAKSGNYMTFDHLIDTGLVEFLDVEEEETSMIAMNIDDLTSRSDYCYTYTHCEIHPSMILGVCASIIPFPDHNQV